jgi:multicomponent Na+:H+ antiporter subunit G
MIINMVLVGLVAFGTTVTHGGPLHSVFNALVGVLLIAGLLFFLSTCVGILRFPDFYTRLNAAGKGDTLSTILMLVACALMVITSAHHVDRTVVLSAIKIIMIVNFIFIGSPTATHALLEAAHWSEIKPWKRNDPPC